MQLLTHLLPRDLVTDTLGPAEDKDAKDGEPHPGSQVDLNTHLETNQHMLILTQALNLPS